MNTSTADIPPRQAHAFVAVAATCLLALASTLFLALAAPDDPSDRGAAAAEGIRWALHP